MKEVVLFAKQPVYDMNNQVYGFELLYRGELVTSDKKDGSLATTEVIVNYCTGLIENNTHQCKRIFINVDEEFIKSGNHLHLLPENIVLEILESVRPTPDVIESLTKLRRQGFTIALDNFQFEEGKDAFFPLTSIIKIDITNFSIATLRKELSQLNVTGKILLAEKVEDRKLFDAYKEMGFDLFQGYYLEKPTLVKGQKLTANKQSTLNLVSNLCRSDITVTEVSELISTDPNLVVKVLKIVNCPLYPFKRKIHNIREAVVKLGIEVVKQWGIVLSLVASSNQPNELFRTLLIRAKCCELYAKLTKKQNYQEFFVIGLFSGLDAILNIEMSKLLDAVDFPESIRNELITDKRCDQSILSLVMMFENRIEVKNLTMTKEQAFQLNDAYWTSIMWADELMQLVD